MKKWHMWTIMAVIAVVVVFVANRVPFIRSFLYGSSVTVSG